jgi:hypothetical protein
MTTQENQPKKERKRTDPNSLNPGSVGNFLKNVFDTGFKEPTAYIALREKHQEGLAERCFRRAGYTPVLSSGPGQVMKEYPKGPHDLVYIDVNYGLESRTNDLSEAFMNVVQVLPPQRIIGVTGRKELAEEVIGDLGIVCFVKGSGEDTDFLTRGLDEYADRIIGGQ